MAPWDFITDLLDSAVILGDGLDDDDLDYNGQALLLELVVHILELDLGFALQE
jgi:hypothetical protein